MNENLIHRLWRMAACAAIAVAALSACGGGDGPMPADAAAQDTSRARAMAAPLAAPRFNYAEALQKSVLFYEAQQSGKLPPGTASPAGAAIRACPMAATSAAT